MLEPAHVEALRSIVGEKGIITDGADARPYNESYYVSGRAGLIVRPSSTAEVSRVVAYLVTNGLRFVPQSANTGLVGGATPDDSGREVVLSLDRLTGEIEFDRTEGLARVWAGTRLSVLNQRVEEFGYCLPIDLGADPMIGGMISTNTGGARFIRYGDMRRHVRGLEVVLPDRHGTVLGLMSSLRKDNSRADLKHLFIGTWGSHGIVTRAALELRKKPIEVATAIVVPRDELASVDVLLALEARLGDYLSAFEGMSQNALVRAARHVPRLRWPFGADEPPPYIILVELSRDTPRDPREPSLDDRLTEALTDLFADGSGSVVNALPGPPEELWALRHAIPDGVRASGKVIAFDLSFERSAVFGFRRAALDVLERRYPELKVCDFGHIADGGVHFNLVHDGHPTAQYTASVRQEVIALAVSFGGSFSGEHGVGRLNQPFYEQYTPRSIQRITTAMRGILASGDVG